MNKKKINLRTEINLLPEKLKIYGVLKFLQKVIIILCALTIVFVGAFAVKGFIEVDGLKREVAEDKQIIAEGRLDELNALKEQYDNLILGIDSGNITLIPNIETKMTELFTIITQYKPAEATLTGVEGQLKSSGEYTYRMEYASTDRTVVANFLKKLQAEKLEYINVSTISKSIINENVCWVFSITVKIGGIK